MIVLNSQSIIDALLIEIRFGGVFYIDAVLVLGVKRCNHPVVGCEDVADAMPSVVQTRLGESFEHRTHHVVG